MIGDMINRLTRKSVPDDLSSLEGIVLIDEIDLHLHPKYQRLFVEKLTELFPKIQFIVSTHSSVPLLGAHKIRLLSTFLVLVRKAIKLNYWILILAF